MAGGLTKADLAAARRKAAKMYMSGWRKLMLRILNRIVRPFGYFAYANPTTRNGKTKWRPKIESSKRDIIAAIDLD